MAKIFPVQIVFEDSSAWLLARVVGMANTNITQASIASITLRVYSRAPESTAVDDPAVVASRTLVKADVVFDSLQTDSGWDVTKDPDGLGFNLKVEVLATDIPQGSEKYRFELRFTDTSTPAKSWPVVVEVPTEGLYTS